MRAVGIDPGKEGAIVIIDDPGTLVAIADMPIAAGELDGRAFAELLMDAQPISRVFIEKVHSMPKQGVASTWRFAQNYGGLIHVLQAGEIPFERVPPQKWKASFSLNGKPKDAARALCSEMWPEAASDFRLVKHGGRADAALIAEHGRRTWS